jgi:transcriptional regulator with XRE-family HTH domain
MAGKGTDRGEEHWVTVAQAIKARMAELGITQIDLATKASVGLSTIQELTAGVVRRRQARTLAAISEALGWPSDQILRLSQGRGRPDVREQANSIRDELRSIRQDQEAITRRLDALEAHIQTER